MASNGAIIRLKKDYIHIKRSPVPYVLAEPDPQNLLNWHYLIIGPPDTPYANGIYHGILKFPKDYPFKPPSIIMYTPSGRFKPSTRICLSMSDYHPESWNPSWNVGSILTGLVSFMVAEDNALGTISDSLENRKQLARDSFHWNTRVNQNTTLGKKFNSLFEEFLKKEEEKRLRDQELHIEQLVESVTESVANSHKNKDKNTNNSKNSTSTNNSETSENNHKNNADRQNTEPINSQSRLKILSAIFSETIGPINWGSVAIFLFVATFAYVANYILGTVQ